VHLVREFDSAAKHNTVAPFADILRKALEEKISVFLPKPSLALDIQALEPIPAHYQTASAGD
jgi:hypothetical protein